MAISPLQIKVNALKRLLKEEGLYHKEAEEHEATIAKMRAEKADEYDIKKMVEVLKDTEKMFPELRKKITEVLAGLKSAIADSGEDRTEANEVVAAAEIFLSK